MSFPLTPSGARPKRKPLHEDRSDMIAARIVLDQQHLAYDVDNPYSTAQSASSILVYRSGNLKDSA